MAFDALPDEFLYHDPDTGVLVVMVRDADGFRPATALESDPRLDWDVAQAPAPAHEHGFTDEEVSRLEGWVALHEAMQWAELAHPNF